MAVSGLSRRSEISGWKFAFWVGSGQISQRWIDGQRLAAAAANAAKSEDFLGAHRWSPSCPLAHPGVSLSSIVIRMPYCLACSIASSTSAGHS